MNNFTLPYRLFNSAARFNHWSIFVRNISLSPSLRLKQIVEEKKDNETIIRGEYIASSREPFLLRNEHPSTCALCSTGLEVKHTDVLILSQFLRSDGCVLPRRITGLCRKQQKRVSKLVAMAQKAGLMSNINPPNSKKDPKLRYGWKKCNKYFDENTIKV